MLRKIVLTLAVLSTCVVASTTFSYSKDVKLPQIVTAAATIGELSAPFGWRDFCRKYAQECDAQAIGAPYIELTVDNWQILRNINEVVNRDIEPVSDFDHWGVAESWDIPTDGKGDCEDFALLKRKMLIALKLSPSALLMTIVYNRRHEGHAVLTVVTDRGDFILDNQTDAIMGWEQTGYRFVERQSARNPNIWVRLSDSPAEIIVSSRK
jgi:predicted transglutaminase-like cysteine proteinase